VSIQSLLNKIRDLSLDLRPALLDDLGLLPALLAYLERFSDQTGIYVEFKHTGLDRNFPSEIQNTAFRIIQEGLTNIARHAYNDQINLRVWADATLLGLQIEDQGVGFEPLKVLQAGNTTGLAGVVERVNFCNGQVDIESESGGGTILTAELPLP